MTGVGSDTGAMIERERSQIIGILILALILLLLACARFYLKLA
jgi:hypothetical protein